MATFQNDVSLWDVAHVERNRTHELFRVLLNIISPRTNVNQKLCFNENDLINGDEIIRYIVISTYYYSGLWNAAHTLSNEKRI